MSAAITVENLSKRYVIQHESQPDTLRDSMQHTARRLWRKFRWGTGFTQEEFWALRDVSFEVQPGEVVGIVGRNGAGKSTLLKVLSRITEPTEGRIKLRGRVASLLEVGTGFHPELSGRENVFLNGAILGMSRAEIRRKFDEIVAFAEVERFLDTPVKRYSSGMYVRLAFAVAAHLEPEILIVDEVLAVGDASFQKKCLGKMQQVSSGEGRTVLFVSHNVAAIRRICQRAVLLHAGTKVADGTVEPVLEAYMQQITGFNQPDKLEDPSWNPPEFRHLLRIDKIVVTNASGVETSTFRMDEPVRIAAHYRVLQPIPSLRFSLHLRTAEEVLAIASTDADEMPVYGAPRPVGAHIVTCTVPGGLLAPRRYFIRFGAYLPKSQTSGGDRTAHSQVVAGGDNLASFEVAETAGPVAPKMLGAVAPMLAWTNDCGAA